MFLSWKIGKIVVTPLLVVGEKTQMDVPNYRVFTIDNNFMPILHALRQTVDSFISFEVLKCLVRSGWHKHR